MFTSIVHLLTIFCWSSWRRLFIVTWIWYWVLSECVWYGMPEWWHPYFLRPSTHLSYVAYAHSQMSFSHNFQSLTAVDTKGGFHLLFSDHPRFHFALPVNFFFFAQSHDMITFHWTKGNFVKEIEENCVSKHLRWEWGELCVPGPDPRCNITI